MTIDRYHFVSCDVLGFNYERLQLVLIVQGLFLCITLYRVV